MGNRQGFHPELVETWLDHGGGWNDVVLFTHAYRRPAAQSRERLNAVTALAAVAHPSVERRQEQLSQGAAFRRTALDSDTAPAFFVAPGGEISYRCCGRDGGRPWH